MDHLEVYEVGISWTKKSSSTNKKGYPLKKKRYPLKTKIYPLGKIVTWRSMRWASSEEAIMSTFFSSDSRIESICVHIMREREREFACVCIHIHACT
jgi:hypothetical protein